MNKQLDKIAKEISLSENPNEPFDEDGCCNNCGQIECECE